MAVDPLDETYISLQKSPNVPNQEASEGAFAKTDTPEGTVFSLYSGHVWDEVESEMISRWKADKFKETHDDDPAKIQQLSEKLWMYRYNALKIIGYICTSFAVSCCHMAIMELDLLKFASFTPP